MTTSMHDFAGKPGRAPSQQRHDERQRAIIDHAIAVQRSSNTIAALEYLKSNNIAPGLIERVLLEPARRRALQHS